jgi:hypothetical protein
VVLVAEEQWQCGVDVVSPQLLHFSVHMPLLQRIQQLASYFSASEVCVCMLISQQCTVCCCSFRALCLESGDRFLEKRRLEYSSCG